MCSELFHIGPIVIRAYGLTLALSFLIGLMLVRRQARLIGLDPERLVSLGFVLIIAGVIGGRLGYVLYHWGQFWGHPLDIINPFSSSGEFGIAGLNLQGGLLAGLIAGLWYLRRHRVAVAAGFDAVVPAIAFGLFLTRIGCFMNGCCFGTPTSLPWGVEFPWDAPAYNVFGEAAVHPAQLYSSLYGLLLFAVLLAVNRYRYRPGLATGLFLVFEAVFRFAIEPFRYYEDAMLFSLADIRVTHNQVVALIMFVIGIVFLLRSRRGRRSPRETIAAGRGVGT